MTKEEIEFDHVSKFWQTLNLYPEKLPISQKPPEPDFYVESPTGLVGIEHTRLFHKADARNIDPVIHNVVAEQIIVKAEAIYNSLNKTKLYVYVSFRNDYGLSSKNPLSLKKTDIKHLSNFIAKFVDQNIPEPGCSFTFDACCLNADLEEILPNLIDTIEIENTDSRNDTCWLPVFGITVPRIYESSSFLTAIDNKNKKPAMYERQYFQIWLLMIENEYDPKSYFDFHSPVCPHIISPFNKIFIFRIGKREIIELKNARPENEQWPCKS